LRLSKKPTTSPLAVPSGVLLLKKEEEDMELYINTFPSFPRRGVPIEVSGRGGFDDCFENHLGRGYFALKDK
jgi:hypothetical protein